MTWASEPSAASHTAINMTASTAVDDISAVEYNFLCVVSGAGCTDSGWQSGTGYTATGLSASTNYTFQVRARDQAGNETKSSVSASATTNAPPPPPLTPSNFSAAGISETAISLSWTDNATNETAYRVERSPDGLNIFATIASLASNATGYTDTGLSSDTTYDYRVAAVNDSGDSGFANASGTTDAPPPYTNYGASSDTAMAGNVSGSVANTRSDDASTQSITERDSGGKPANRYAYLEHRWNFNVSLGATVTVYANVWSGSSTGDTFNFEYSLDNGDNFSQLPQLNVSTTENSNLQSAVIPGTPSSSIIIRVVDADHTRGNRDQNTVFVDHLYIQVGNPSSDPPIGDPSGLTATAVSSSQIDLSWTDGTENEAGFTVDVSPNGSTGWVQIADLPGGSTSYIDTGLTAETAYYYRVRAHNPNGFSTYTSAYATTPVAPPPPALSLTANAYKVKGKHHVGLSWTSSSDVDIYRNGDLLELVPPGIVIGSSDSSYDDNIGAKGGAAYEHQVCVAGTGTCSNVTTSIF
jgi:titin